MMDCENAKGKPLTKKESKSLLDLIEGSKILATKATNATNNKLKNEEWKRLTEQFNATATNFPRTPQQLRLKWENLKKNSRKRSTKIFMNQIKTGGDPPVYIPPDDILDRVSDMLSSADNGFTVSFGDDKETVDSDDGEHNDDGDARVSEEEVKNAVIIPKSVDCGIVTVECSNDGSDVVVNTDHQISHNIDQSVLTPDKSRGSMLNTPRAVRKKIRTDESRTARNIAIAEYFIAKKQCIDAKLNNIYLENKKLLLETEKLKLELQKLKKQ